MVPPTAIESEIVLLISKLSAAAVGPPIVRLPGRVIASTALSTIEKTDPEPRVRPVPPPLPSVVVPETLRVPLLVMFWLARAAVGDNINVPPVAIVVGCVNVLTAFKVRLPPPALSNTFKPPEFVPAKALAKLTFCPLVSIEIAPVLLANWLE